MTIEKYRAAEYEAALDRDNWRCWLCGVPLVGIDGGRAHIVAQNKPNVEKYGRYVIDNRNNFRMSCNRCNSYATKYKQDPNGDPLTLANKQKTIPVSVLTEEEKKRIIWTAQRDCDKRGLPIVGGVDCPEPMTLTEVRNKINSLYQMIYNSKKAQKPKPEAVENLKREHAEMIALRDRMSADEALAKKAAREKEKTDERAKKKYNDMLNKKAREKRLDMRKLIGALEIANHWQMIKAQQGYNTEGVEMLYNQAVEKYERLRDECEKKYLTRQVESPII